MTNLGFLSTVMWDGRESTPPSTKTIASNADLQTDLSHQALSAVNSHTQPLTPLTTSQQQTIVNFELGLFTAQSSDSNAGPLDQAGATGSFLPLVNQQFFIGINDPQGQNPSGAPFTPKIFDLFDAWANSSDQAKASIARGQAIFNSRTFSINGATGLGSMTQVSCGTCHNSPNVGTHSVDALMNIGVADPARGLDQSYLAVFTLKNTTTGETLTTTDPGRALITGKWTDIGAFKVPSLRGLAGRPPYFHNGSAASLSDVVTFLDGRFGIGMNAQEKTDLVAFLSAL